METHSSRAKPAICEKINKYFRFFLIVKGVVEPQCREHFKKESVDHLPKYHSETYHSCTQ